MSIECPTSDADLMDLLRISGSMGVSDLSRKMEVTPTAVRQRLIRLLAQGLIQREVLRAGRGRPKHLYDLTDKGLRLTGSNFTDLALALWREISASGQQGIPVEVVQRIAKSLAAGYAGEIRGNTTAERMRSLSELLAQRRIPVTVKDLSKEVVMTAHACPYPQLAEQDRNVCAMEEMLFSTLLGHDVELTHCRLDGGSDCQFQAK